MTMDEDNFEVGQVVRLIHQAEAVRQIAARLSKKYQVTYLDLSDLPSAKPDETRQHP